MKRAQIVVGCVAAMGVAAALSGCSSGSSASAKPDASPIFDPCKLTVEQLAVVGDRLSWGENSDIGPQNEESRGCSWSSDWYGLGVESFAHTFDETRRNTSFAQFTPIEIPGRAQAAKFTSPGDTFEESCGIVIGVPQGSIVVNINNIDAITGTSSHNTCDKAVEITEKLDRYFPR